MSLSLEGADDAEANEVAASNDVADGTAVRYDGAIDGSDLLFQVGQQAVYQTVELKAAPGDQLSYEWLVNAPGLEAVRQDSGDIEFLDSVGDVVFDIPGPIMWDSLGGDGGMADSASTPVSYTLENAGSGRWRLALSPDLEWLRDPARVYPVSIDPDIYPGSGQVTTFKEDNWSYNYGATPRIGNSKQTSTCCAWRTVLRYPMNAYFGKRLTGAALVANWTYGTTTNQHANVWWANSFNFAGNGAWIASFDIATQGVAYGGVFDAIAGMMNNSDLYSYMMLTGEESDAIYSRKDLSTYVYITYVDPAVVTGVVAPSPTSPQAGPLTKVDVDNIVVQATGQNNTPGTTQLFRYNFLSSDGGAAWNSGWVSPGAFRLPDTALTPGKSYWYTIDSMDTGTASPVKPFGNPTYMFRTAAAPGAVSAVTVDGKALSANVTSNAARPVIAATVTSSEAGSVRAIFTVKRGGVVVMDGVTGSPVDVVAAGGSGVSSAVLPYAITSDSSYTIEVQAFDGHLAGPSMTPPGSFTGPPRTIREIPGSQDSEMGATS